MADKDNFKKVSDAPEKSGMVKLDDLLAASRDGSRSSKRSKKKEKGTTCCGYFSIKVGFILYGAFDIITMIALFSVIIHFLVIKKKVVNLLWASLILAVPNAFSFTFVMISDRAITRKIYTYILAVKLAILAFTIPFLFMYANNDWMYDQQCMG
jgi:hypothetical protein